MDNIHSWFSEIINGKENNVEQHNIEVIEKMATLFCSPKKYFSQRSTEEVALGLRSIISATGFGYSGLIVDSSIPIKARLHCLDSMFHLFQYFFLTECFSELSHMDHGCSDHLTLNETCYMWWDWCLILPKQDSPEIDTHVLSLFVKILNLDSIACKESAIHGLGHWFDDYPKEVSHILDVFLNQQKLPSELESYAMKAKQGLII